MKRAVLALAAAAALLAGAGTSVFATCGPFGDVAKDSFCPFVLEIFYMGITTGTTPTTYSPAASVDRLQMAAFLSRTVDGVLQRGSRRALVKKFWTPKNGQVLGVTTLPADPFLVVPDGKDLWVTNTGTGVWRVRASDGRLLEEWTGASGARGLLAAMRSVFVTGSETPGRLYRIDPSQAAGAVTTVASNVSDQASQLAFDGSRIWATGDSGVSIVTPGATLPWTVTTVTAGFETPLSIDYDGANIWISDIAPRKLHRLDGSGGILQTVTLDVMPGLPAFDGTNFWYPGNGDDGSAVVVLRASTGAVLATLTNAAMGQLAQAAFDGQRVLVTDVGGNLFLWKAADFSSLGFVSTGSPGLVGVCSDGANFWITNVFEDKLLRF